MNAGAQSTLYDDVQTAAANIRKRIGGQKPSVGIILGSGLGGFADRLMNPVCIPYSDIPYFPASTIAGHAGKLVIGSLHGTTCIAMQGRCHFYEGHGAAITTIPARTLITLGARSVVITNAAGGIRSDLTPGTLMLISDHINLLPENPLRGAHDDRLGARFPDMSRAYAPGLRELAKECAVAAGLSLAEGVYAACSGPSYETPAEVRMLRTLGADAVGMSTVPETIVANQMGAEVLGISCITNLAAGLSDAVLSHDEVTATAARVRGEFESLLDAIIARLAGR